VRFLQNLFGYKPVWTLDFALAGDGIAVRLLKDGKPSTRHEVLAPKAIQQLPAPLIDFWKAQTRDEVVISLPQAVGLGHQLTSYRIDKFIFNNRVIQELTKVERPTNFGLHWRLNHSDHCLERQLMGAERHLGEGWFQAGALVWTMGDGLPASLLECLSRPRVEGHQLYRFLAEMMPLAMRANLPVTCDVQLRPDISLMLRIRKTLKRSLDVELVFSDVTLPAAIEHIKGDPNHVLCGNSLLPDIGPLLHGRLARARSTIRISGDDLPAFIQDELRVHAQKLKVNMQGLDEAFPIIDAAQLTQAWRLEHEFVQGIGRFKAAPLLCYQNEEINEKALTQILDAGGRFLALDSGWVEFTADAKATLQQQIAQGFQSFYFSQSELLGVDRRRVEQTGLQFPGIELAAGREPSDDAFRFVQTMRHYGLPAVVTGLQQDIVMVWAKVCDDLLASQPGARVLWVVGNRKRNAVIDAVKQQQFAHHAMRTSRLLITSPEALPEQAVKVDWTALILHDLDQLAINRKHAAVYATLKRTWTMASLAKSVWPQDRRHNEQLLASLQLGAADGPALQARCLRQYPEQQTGFFDRLTSLFRPVTATYAGVPSSDMAIPPRRESPPDARRPAPGATPASKLTPVSSSPLTPPPLSAIVTTINEGFVQQAQRYANRTETWAEAIPFKKYWPTYSDMSPDQQRWYFFWRTQLGMGEFLPIDTSYLFIHIYEALNLVGFGSAQEAHAHLVKFWQHYRTLHPRLDDYLVDWIADFAVIHKLPQAPLDWYAEVAVMDVAGGDLAMQMEAWFQRHHKIDLLPAGLMCRVSGYEFTKSKFYQTYQRDLHLLHEYRKGLECVDRWMRSKDGKSFFERYAGPPDLTVRRSPFAGALHEHQKEPVEIAQVRSWINNEELTEALGAIFKQTENILRERVQYKSRLRGIKISQEWANLIQGGLAAPARQRTKLQIDMASVAALARESASVRERLLAHVQAEEKPSLVEASAKRSGSSEIVASPSDTLPSFAQRPMSAPDGLLTSLAEVAVVMGSHHEPTAALLRAFSNQDWQASLGELQAGLQNGFVNAVLDQINERAFQHLGDKLIVYEGDTWVVAEDFRDEIGHILNHPDYGSPAPPAPTVQNATPAQLSSPLSGLHAAWATFAIRLQMHHWQSLACLLDGIDINQRLDAIARNVHLTANRLIDDINEFALDSVGDIVVDIIGDTPQIEEEDVQDLLLVMQWGAEQGRLGI
jgi:hypothetical protein